MKISSVITAVSVIAFITVRVCAEDLSELSSWSIPHEPSSIPFVMKQQLPQSTNSESMCGNERPPTYIFLTRPKEEKYVAVLQVYQACPAVLNPKGFKYGPIPELNNLTKSDANVLWGKKSKANLLDEVTYTLTGMDKKDYFLDLVFDKNKLQKYRVRSEALRTTMTWMQAG